MKTIKIRTAKHIVLLLASSSILYSHAGAQLEEVIVTAQKREQNLQNVPMAVSAFGREMLEENNVSSIRDLTQLVPSLRITELSNPTDRAIRVRGVGTDVYSGAVEPNVSVVVDEVPLARTSMAMLEFDDLERVEVLRGPQGTLFGKNSTAGLVHIISRDPAPEFEAFTTIDYMQPASFPGSNAKVQFGLSGPIASSLGARFSGFYKESRGHLEDILQDKNVPNSDAYGARLKLRWDPADTLIIKLSLEYQNNEADSTPFTFRSANPAKEARDTRIHYSDSNRTTKGFSNASANTENSGISLIANWDLGSHTLTSVTGYRDFTVDGNTPVPDLDGERYDVTESGQVRDFSTFTQELRLTSNENEVLEYTVGALWFDNLLDEDYLQIVENIPIDGITGGVFPGFPSTEPTGVDAPSTLTASRISEVGNQNLGVFAQGTWHATDRWHLTSGVRYINERLTGSVERRRDIKNEATGAPVQPESVVKISGAEISDEVVTGMASLQYDWNDSSMVYLSASTGYRGGTFDLNASDLEEAFADPVKPETSSALELGMKSRWLDNRLQINIAVFDTIFKNFQAQLLEVVSDNVVPTGKFRLANAGELETRGVELEFQAKPTDALLVYGSFLYNDAVFNEFIVQCFPGQEPGEAGGVDNDDNGTCDEQDVSGGVLPNAPKLSFNINGRYDIALPNFDSSAYVQLAGRWTDEIQYTAEQHPLAIADAFSIWNLRFGWLGLEERLQASLYINNIFAQNYTMNLFPLSVENDRRDVIHVIPMGADRVFGLTVGYGW
ncbi:TonB-dependent receptor [Zhongshania sp.]|uniref:TonB-dependent receptor n=3 Tax=Zhongshania sp. TaxID=1971902 RepID=UPI003565769D